MHKQMICYGIVCLLLIFTINSCSESDAADGTVDPAVLENTIQQYFTYANSEELDNLMALFDANAVFNMPIGQEDVTGLVNIRAAYNMVYMFSPYHVDDPQEIFIKGNQAAVLINAYSGTSADDATLIKAMDHMTFNSEGKITSVRVIFDSAPVLCPDAIPAL